MPSLFYRLSQNPLTSLEKTAILYLTVRSFDCSFERRFPLPSVRQIAEQADVSISTVSLVLNNKPGVSDAMRARVREAINQLGGLEETSGLEYAGGPRLVNNHQLSVVVLHPALLRSSQVFSELLQGIQAGAARYQLQLRLAVNERGLPSDHISQIYFSDPSLYPDGVLVIGARLDEPVPEQVLQLCIPSVLVGRDTSDQVHSCVGRDEEAGAYEATDYLLGLGHRAIAFVGGDPAYSYTHSRLHGYARFAGAWRQCLGPVGCARKRPGGSRRDPVCEPGDQRGGLYQRRPRHGGIAGIRSLRLENPG